MLRKLASAISGQYQSIAAVTYLPEGYLRLRLRFAKPRFADSVQCSVFSRKTEGGHVWRAP